MLLTLKRRRRGLLAEEVIDRLENELGSVAYTAPELANTRRAQIVAACRRIIHEYRGQQ